MLSDPAAALQLKLAVQQQQQRGGGGGAAAAPARLRVPWEPLLAREEVLRGMGYYGSGARLRKVAAKLLAGQPIKVSGLLWGRPAGGSDARAADTCARHAWLRAELCLPRGLCSPTLRCVQCAAPLCHTCSCGHRPPPGPRCRRCRRRDAADAAATPCRPARHLQVATLGGSVTKGSGASSPEASYPSRLFQLLNASFPHRRVLHAC